MALIQRVFFLLLSFGLYACGAYMEAPVEDLGQKSRYQRPTSAGVSTYKVVKGDTLFSIALRHDLDYKKLAAANNIYPPYIIRPDDVIYLRETASVPGVASASRAVKPQARVNSSVSSQSVKNTGVISGKRVQENQVRNAVGASGQPAVSKSTPVPATQSQRARAGESVWIWPASGTMIRGFSPQDALSKGIDISAVLGTPVVAARSGEVVYAGNGLKGYGNLIIIRHDDVYISAYAHNKTILVKEGQRVGQGEKVAELGMSGTQVPKLHFEIREHGKPIDPLKLLPKK